MRVGGILQVDIIIRMVQFAHFYTTVGASEFSGTVGDFYKNSTVVIVNVHTSRLRQLHHIVDGVIDVGRFKKTPPNGPPAAVNISDVGNGRDGIG